jgi:hypothetical protein
MIVPYHPQPLLILSDSFVPVSAGRATVVFPPLRVNGWR